MDSHIKNQELQEEFYQKVVKEKFPDIDRKHSAQMTSAVFRKLADQMRDGGFPKVRLKGFGIFQVYIKRASYYLQQLKTGLNNQNIEPEIYFKYRDATVKYIMESLKHRARVLKEEIPEELVEVLLHKKDPEEGRTQFFYKYKQWLK